MSNELTVTINEDDLKALRKKYGEDLMQRVIVITEKYMGDTGYVKQDAKKIIEDAGQVDTGRLIGSIKPSLKRYADRVTATINAGTKYARFIHEGAEHSTDGKKKRMTKKKGEIDIQMKVSEAGLIPHFVSFSVAPGLKTWAIRHKKIQRIRGDWYFIDKNNQEHLIKDINKSGMMVYQRPLKYFEIPFEEYAPKYVSELEGLLK